MADKIASIKDMKTVAYIDDRPLGVAALLPLACRDIVFKKSARMGDVRQIISGTQQPLARSERRRCQSLAKKAALPGAARKATPRRSPVAMVDPEAEVVEATDLQDRRYAAHAASQI